MRQKLSLWVDIGKGPRQVSHCPYLTAGLEPPVQTHRVSGGLLKPFSSSGVLSAQTLLSLCL